MRRLVAMVAGLAAAVVLTVGVALPAMAGNNGQQLALYGQCNTNWVLVTGRNQDSVSQSRWFLISGGTPETFCRAPVHYLKGWWWKGRVEIDGYWGMTGGRGSDYQGTVYVDVPVQQSGSDWVYADAP